MSNLEFGRGRDKKKRKSRRRKGTLLAAGGIGTGVATVGAAVLWGRKKRTGAGIPGVPGFNNQVKAITGNPVGDAQQSAIAKLGDNIVKVAPSKVMASDDFAKTFIPQSSRFMSDVQDVAKSSYEGIKGASDSLVTRAKEGKMSSRKNPNSYAGTRTNSVVDALKGVKRGTSKVIGSASYAKRRANADILVLKKQFGK